MKITNMLRKRSVQMCLIDWCIFFVTGLAAFFISNMVSFVHLSVENALHFMIPAAVCMSLALILGRVYRIIWKYANARDYMVCMVYVTIGAFAGYAVARLAGVDVSEIFALIMCLFSVIGTAASRIVYNYLYRVMGRHEGKDKKNTLIVGAGDTCNQLLQEMLQSDMCRYKPLVIVDDDSNKLKRCINSIPIAGTTNDIPALAEKYKIGTILFAIPSCDNKEKKRILSICSETECEIKVIPYVHELIEGKKYLEQAMPVKVEDLLGRDVIKLDNPLMKQTIEGKVCLVTGGGGSIGSELSRQIARNKPKSLIILDIYENNAYDIQQELIIKYGNSLDLHIEIASVRDWAKLDAVFEKYKPELVFHAAAHKHVPLMETNPEEAIKNNIFGTFNTAELAKRHNAEKFVLVSTDKAVNPTNVMGATKRCCEMVVQYMAQDSKKTEFIAVRFGNVLGSNGSVIPLFERQLAENKPLTVTHPEIIRYFMTIPEAVSLILEAVTIARGGEIFVLDMGEPVKILTLAENLIKLHGKRPYVDVGIEFTGLRPGEKLYEELLMDEEGLRRTENNRIFVGQQIEVDGAEFMEELRVLKEYADENRVEECVDKLSEIVPTFTHESEKKAVV